MQDKKILVLNSGSSSIKVKIFKVDLSLIAQILIEKIGETNSYFTLEYNRKNYQKNDTFLNHNQALESLVKFLKEYQIIQNFEEEVLVIGHRVVMGGSLYNKAVIVDKKVVEDIQKIAHLAPLHNYPNLLGIKQMQKLVNKPNVVVFDTAFHQSLDQKQFLYPLPNYLYQKHMIRKYGMHGISYRYNLDFFKKQTNLKKPNLIIFHLGNGSSVCAIKDGLSYNTSMGLTPLAGLMMGTRSGDIDPAISLFLQKELAIDAKKVDDILNRQSGLLAISQKTNDMREIINGVNQNDPNCILAFEMYVDRLVNYYSEYLNQLENKCDGIIFTGGIGFNSKDVVQRFVKKVAISSLELEKDWNLQKNDFLKISTKNSQFPIYVLKTNEEIEIAKQALSLLEKELLIKKEVMYE